VTIQSAQKGPLKNNHVLFLLGVFVLIILGVTLVFVSRFEGRTAEIPVFEMRDRPNILWLVLEDMSPTLPAYGDDTITTPNISRLAREGVTYTNVYSPSGVCSPSRASLATGKCEVLVIIRRIIIKQIISLRLLKTLGMTIAFLLIGETVPKGLRFFQ